VDRPGFSPTTIAHTTGDPMTDGQDGGGPEALLNDLTGGGAPPENSAEAAGDIRERLGRERFRRQVKAGVEAGLKKEAGKKKGAQFKASEVPDLMRGVRDQDIDRATEAVLAGEGAEATPQGEGAEPAEGDGAEAKGPIRDWFAENKDLIRKVIEYLLDRILTPTGR
jgi:hypothetical protein